MPSKVTPPVGLDGAHDTPRRTSASATDKAQHASRGLGDSPNFGAPGSRPRRGGLYDSIDAGALAASKSAGIPKGHQGGNVQHQDQGPRQPHAQDAYFSAAGGGSGGLSGPRDPYDRPTRSQLLGARSRLRQDKASGALEEVAGRYREQFGSQRVVRKGLRRSIADAYAAYVGQVVHLPDDLYGLALGALDRSFNGRHGPSGRPAGLLDLQLHTSPFATSRAKHAQIFNTAKRIMRDLDAYVYDVSYYCPGELDELRGMRGPPGAARGAAAAAEGYKSDARPAAGTPPLHREAAHLERRSADPRRPAGQQRSAPSPSVDLGRSAPRPYTVNPITGAIRPAQTQAAAGAAASGSAAGHQPQQQGGRQASGSASGRPQTAPPAAVSRGGGAGGGGASAERSAGRAGVAAGEGRRAMGSAEQEQRRRMRRLSSPGSFVRTPTHYRISRYYDHVSPTEDVLQYLRKRAARRAHRQAAAAESGAAAVADTDTDREREREREEQEALDEATLAAMQQVLSIGTARGGSDPRGGQGAWQAGAGPGPGRGRSLSPPMRGYADDTPVPVDSSNAGRPAAVAGFAEAAAAAAASAASRADPRVGGQGPDAAGPAFASTTDRIAWIVETAYELGLAEALGLEWPPPHPRSRRLSPSPHRRRFYDAVYDSPEAYDTYVPYTEGGGGGRRRSDAGGEPPAVGYGRRGSPVGQRDGIRQGGEPDGTAQRLRVAAARRYVAEAGPAPEVVRHGRSRRVSAW